MEDVNETALYSSAVWTSPERSRSSPTSSGDEFPLTTLHMEFESDDQRAAERRYSYVADDGEPSANDDDDDDESVEIRALTSLASAVGSGVSDESSDEAPAVCCDGQDDPNKLGSSFSSEQANHLAPHSSLSASVLGRIANGFSTAVSGGLHPIIRSPRVAPELPSPRRPGSRASTKATPRSPSPKDFFWHPVKPGYPTAPTESDETKATMVIRQTVQLEQTQTSNNSNDGDIGLRQAIPVMPMFLAVICCLCNALSPGLGTFVAGVSLTCCSRPQQDNLDRCSLLLVNVWVAIFQLISAFLFLVGWIWSLIWGFSFITISRELSGKKEGTGTGSSATGGQNGARVEDAGCRPSSRTTTTTAVTRTTTTTVSLPDDSASTPPSVSREPPIIVLQEAPVAPPQHHDLLDAAAAAVWIERQRMMRVDPVRAAARTRNATDTDHDNQSSQPMSRRQRINRRRRQRAATASTASPGAGPWNDPLTGVLLCPEALEHIVVRSNVVPDPNAASGSSGSTSISQPHK